MATLTRGELLKRDAVVASCSTDDGTGRRRPAHRLTPRHVLLLSDAGPVVAGSTHGGLLGRALVITCFALVRAARRAPGRAPFPRFFCASSDRPAPSPSSQLCYSPSTPPARVDDDPGGHAPAAAPAYAGTRAPGGEAPSWRTLLEPAAPEGAAAAARYAHNVPAPDASRDRALELELRSLKEQVALLTKLTLRPAPAEPPPPADVPPPRRDESWTAPTAEDDDEPGTQHGAPYGAHVYLFEENATVYFPDDNSTHAFGNVTAVLASLHNATQVSGGRSADDDTPCFTRSRRVSARPTPCRARARDALDASAVRIASSK